jgi:hypothetical protein
MPTEQEVIDAVVLDEDVPHFIQLENKQLLTMFTVARKRRGKKREEAFEKLQEFLESKLVSVYKSYKSLVSILKVKATKAWVEEDCSAAVTILRDSVHKLILQKQKWQLGFEKLVVENSELLVENVRLKNDLRDNLPEEENYPPPPYSSVSCKNSYGPSRKLKNTDPEE